MVDEVAAVWFVRGEVVDVLPLPFKRLRLQARRMPQIHRGSPGVSIFEDFVPSFVFFCSNTISSEVEYPVSSTGVDSESLSSIVSISSFRGPTLTVETDTLLF